MVVAGAGFGALLGAPTRYIVTSHVGPEQRASAVGLLSVFLIMGQIVGGSLGGGVASSHGDAVNGYRVAYLVFAAVAVGSGAAHVRAGVAASRARGGTRAELTRLRRPCLGCEETSRPRRKAVHPLPDSRRSSPC